MKSSDYYYDDHAAREESGANLRNYWILRPAPAVFLSSHVSEETG